MQLAKLGGNPNVDVHTMPDYLQAQAKVDEAQRELDHTVIYAPFDGIVTQVDTVQPGMYLAASTAAFGIVSTEDVWVEANPKETELTWVKPGDQVDVTVDTYPGRTWDGHGAEHRAQQRLGILDAAGAEHLGQLGEGGAAHPGAHRCRPQARRSRAARRHERRGRDRHRPPPHLSDLF